ncbi:FGGY-family carbohydrate kinase [Ciceribacter sp. L1K22]|uniref:FGGY-family carbohydrate kinase n=1 Tax=Ciceribacter sp. L1K22 TaxID=2820275 RepID=UPI001ABE59CF|nr:FGGY-family carbohydrate kinase [Ciceribacter sp. L1K22]MBO3761367.1 FGGY-family carbohydrate kinase [Ciceribacter sp. L1K22]
MSQSHKRIAVIDIGKTNAKVVVVDAVTGVELAVRKTANAVLSGPSYPHYDIEALWQFILKTLKDFAANTGFDALSITTHGASAALLDADGKLALPVLDYEYLYPDTVTVVYRELRPAFSDTFSPLLTGGLNIGAQLHYQKTAFPDAFAKVKTILTYPQYWAYRLTGVAANERTSLGCHTDLWLPYSNQFSPLVEKLDLAERMAPVRSAFDVLGEIRPNLAREIGVTRPVPVYCGIHDSNASLLPYLVDRALPCTVVSTGTWVVCFAPGARPDGLDSTRDTLVNVDAFGNPVPSSRYMGGREWEMITHELPLSPLEDEWQMLATVIDRGSMLLPSIVKGCGPFPAMEGRWILKPDDAAEIRIAASLYQALMTTTCLDIIRSQGPIIVEGPFAANAIFLAALHSLTGRPVSVSGSQTGTSVGASVLAGSRPRHSVHLVEETIPGLTEYAATWRRLASV